MTTSRSPRVRRRLSGGGLMAIAAIWLAACGPSPLTATRVEEAIGSTFANLVHVQLTRIGLSPVAVSDLKVTASCYRVAGGMAGAGDWVCTIVWSGPNGRTLHDSYDVSVGTDGCYAASVDSAEAQLGGPTIRTPDGREVRNLLYAFEGCFDTS